MKLPYKIHNIKWKNVIIVFLVNVFIFFTGSYFDNWTAISKFIFRSDGFSNYCSPSELEGLPTSKGRCAAQIAKTADLLPVVRSTYTFISPIVGILFDKFGPIFSLAVGLTCAIVYWALLGSFPTNNYALVASFTFFALSVDFCYFPSLNVAELFPKYKNIVMLINGCTASFTSILPVLNNYVLDNTNVQPRHIAFFYAFGVLVLIFVMMIVLYKYYLKPTQENVEANEDLEIANTNEEVPTLWRCMFTVRYLTILAFFCTTNLTLTFHQFYIPTIYDSNSLTIKLLELSFALSFIPCIVFGPYIEKHGINIILIIVNVFASFVPFLSVFKNEVVGVFIAISIMFIYSMYLSSVYCYVKAYFPNKYFGLLSGIATCFGGVSSLMSLPISYLVTSYTSSVIINMFMLGVRLLMLALLVYNGKLIKAQSNVNSTQ